MSRLAAADREGGMARLEKLRGTRPGWLARLAYFVARRKLGHVPEPLKVLNRNGALMLGMGAFETALQRCGRVPGRLKSLAELRVALEVGCPF
jgi:hypothetical protein